MTESSFRINLFKCLFTFVLAFGMAMVCGTATAQDAAKDEFTLEEIIVTAEFREKEIQDTPLSITAVVRQVVVLHVLGSLRFREIARQTGDSINTIQSRYRYGLAKLLSLLNGEVDL